MNRIESSRPKKVTAHQAYELMEMANVQGLSREKFQTALDDHAFYRFIGMLLYSPPGFMEILPPKGGRIFTIRIATPLDRLEQDVIQGKTLKEILEKIDISEKIPEMEDLILLTYPDGRGSWSRALAAGKELGLEKTITTEVLAIAAFRPHLNQEVGFDGLKILATNKLTRNHGMGPETCVTAWDGDHRWSSVEKISTVEKLPNTWFAFRKAKKVPIKRPYPD